MDEKKELTEQEIKQVNGAEWDGHHICGICGAEMTYLRAQPENNSVGLPVSPPRLCPST